MKNSKPHKRPDDLITYTLRIWGQSLLGIIAATVLLSMFNKSMSLLQIIMFGAIGLVYGLLVSTPIFIFMIAILIFIRNLNWPKAQQKLLLIGIYLTLMVSLIFYFSGTTEPFTFYVAAIFLLAIIPALLIFINPLPVSNKKAEVQIHEDILDDDLIHED